MAIYRPTYTTSVEGSGQLATYGTMTYSYGVNASASISDTTNLKTTSVIDNGDSYTINYRVLVGLEKNGWTGPVVQSEAIRYVPKKLELTFYGNKRVIDLTDVVLEYGEPTIFSVSGSEIYTDRTIYKLDKKISELQYENITTDYATGISNGTATIFMGDYYNSAGERVLEWENGEIPQVGQVVYFENDLKSDRTQRYWKITGRTFRWDSSPLVDLQLQEVRVFA